MSNKLSLESSPYLLQHADNPVEWHAWNDESLQRAKDENKPIFLSVGYSSCHWCHVMAHESFEDVNVAEIMNKYFINIKVDREERPDIDDIYQKACQMITGQGGWPLSVFLTPDQKPFYVGTYFPPTDFHGRPSFGSILRQLAQGWREKQTDMIDAAEKCYTSLYTKPQKSVSKEESLTKLIDASANNLMSIADHTYGGFGSAPKFPNSINLSFLFRYSKLVGNPSFQEFALKTLRKMASSGMYDQIGGGFHRYSTNQTWLVPHFEKMLYDNALLIITYAEAFQITKDEFYKNVVIETLDYTLREMTLPDGCFCSSQDADSEKGEGVYYTWSKSEIFKILINDADMFCTYHGVTDGGNFEGSNILHRSMPLSAIAFHTNMSEETVNHTLKNSKVKLLKVRDTRDRPGRDDKVITSWNALMISAFVKGYEITHDEKYLNAAVKCVDFIEETLYKNDKLLRIFKDGESKIHGYLEDYTYLIAALLDLFAVKADRRYIDKAVLLADYTINHYCDEESMTFFMTSDNHDPLIFRPSSDYDLSTPSGSSVAADILQRLFIFTNNTKYHNLLDKFINSRIGIITQNPFAFGNLLNVIYTKVQKPTEITVLSLNDIMIKQLRESFLPEGITVEISKQEQLEQLSKYSFFAGKTFSKEKTTIYVCKDFTCSQPLYSIEDVSKLC